MVDLNETAAQAIVKEFNDQKNGEVVAIAVKADTCSWDEQLAAYEAGKKAFGRIDYFFANAGISERPWLPAFTPSTASTRPITKPNNTTLDVDLVGQLYTAALGLQVFERQDVNRHGFRGKLVLTASIYSYYTCATMPMYNTAKAGILQFMRSAAKLYDGRGVTVNSIAPNLLATNIGPKEGFQLFESRGLLKTPMDLVVQQAISVLGDSKDNGRAISINNDEVWDHPVELTKWKENEYNCNMMEYVGGIRAGYWEWDETKFPLRD
ncbi:NAD(P)-binding protein [Marasmius fiardii PR-910]|nr:NAD(P)-binding protein [Marasmius fiardii PR-910]